MSPTADEVSGVNRFSRDFPPFTPDPVLLTCELSHLETPGSWNYAELRFEHREEIKASYGLREFAEAPDLGDHPAGPALNWLRQHGWQTHPDLLCPAHAH